MPELLTYPWDSRYPTNHINNFFGATAAAPNMPTDSVITEGFGNVTDGEYNWQQSSISGSGSATSAYQRSYANNNIALIVFSSVILIRVTPCKPLSSISISFVNENQSAPLASLLILLRMLQRQSILQDRDPTLATMLV